MNQQAIDFIGTTIANTALQFMADKAGVTVPEILAAMLADTEGKASLRYFADLANAAIEGVPAILAEGARA